MNKSLVFHAVTETVIVTILSIVLYKKISACNNEIQQLKAIVQKQEDQLNKCIQNIQHLYAIIDHISGGPPQPQQRMQAPPPASHEAYAKQMYYAQPQPQQQRPQAPPQNPATDILSTFMNIVPTVLTTISSTNAPAEIIATLDKQSMPTEQSSKPTIDIVDEGAIPSFENDDDINEALNNPTTVLNESTNDV